MNRSKTISRLDVSKSIGMFGGVCLLVNAMTGPSIPYTAQIFQQSGWLAVVLLFVAFALLSTLATLFIVQSMQSIPGNKHFQGEVEFSTLINFYFGRKAHLLGQLCLYAAVQSNSIQCIVLVAQALDTAFVDWFGKTCGLGVSGFGCLSSVGPNGSPFEEVVFVSLGYAATVVLTVPLAILNLDDNILVQMVAFAITIFFAVQWSVASFLFRASTHSSVLDPTPLVPSTNTSIATAIGTVMMSLAFTFVVPSWLNLKKKTVNAQHTLWTSAVFTALLYIVIGLIPALAFQVSPSGNILPSLSTLGPPISLTKWTVFLFPLILLLPAIPVSSIVSYNNLQQNDVFSRPLALFSAYILPWIVAMPFLNGKYITQFLTWTSLLFVSTANFIVPLLVFIKCRSFRRQYNIDRSTLFFFPVTLGLSKKQLKLLKIIHSNSDTIQRFIQEKENESPTTPIKLIPEVNISDATLQSNDIQVDACSITYPDQLRLSTTSINNDASLHPNSASYSYHSLTPPLSSFRPNQTAHSHNSLTPLSISSRLHKRSTTTLRRGISRPSSQSFKHAPTDHEPISPSSASEELPEIPDPEQEDEDTNTFKLEDSLKRAYTRLTSSTFSTTSSKHALPSSLPRVSTLPTHISVISTRLSTCASGLQLQLQIDPQQIRRQQTIPRNPYFTSPFFRILPKWSPLKEITLAWMLLVFMSVLIVVNVVMAFVNPV